MLCQLYLRRSSNQDTFNSTKSFKVTLSWPRRAPPSPLGCFGYFFLTTGAFKSLCLSSTSADLLPGILSAQPEASSGQTQAYTTVSHKHTSPLCCRQRARCRILSAKPDHAKTSLLDLPVSYAHVMFTFCPPQVHQHKHHPQNPRVDRHSHRAPSRVSVCVSVSDAP